MDEKKDDVTPPGGGAGDPPPKESFGYDEPPAGDPPPKEEPPAGDPPPKEEPPKDPPNLSGYGDNPPPKDEPPAGDPPPKDEPPAGDPPKEGDLKVDDKGELLDKEVTDILTFAKKHKLSQDVVNEMVDAKKTQISDDKAYDKKAKEDQVKAVKDMHSKWYTELKNDPDFGGENFRHNSKKVDKLVNEFMPNIKKQLTERGGLLPPYIMRDFYKLATHLYKTEKLVDGEPLKDAKDNENHKPDHIAFYDS